MKILHLIYDDIRNPWCGGGGAVRAYEINRRLARRHDITVITGNYPGAKNEVIDGVRYVRVGSGRSYLLSRTTYSLLVPVISKNFGYDILVDDFSAFSPSFAPLWGKGKVVASILSYLGPHSFRKYPLVGALGFLFEYIYNKTCDVVITISPWLEEKIRGTKPNARVRCIYNGVNDELFHVPSDREEDYILFIGRIDIYTKGIDTLLEAFAKVSCRVPGVALKLAGKGKERDLRKALSLIKKLNIGGKVEIIGPVYDLKRKARLFARSKFVCVPSRFEGWPIVSVEAAAVGKPVVGSRIPGLLDAVKDGETGILVPPEDPEKLADAMVYLLEHEDERRRLGENGRRWARRFRWDEIAQQQEKFYMEVLRNAETW